MSYSYLALLYQTIQAAHPFIPVVALGIVKRYQLGDVSGAEQRRDTFEDAHGRELADALDVCILFLRMYGQDIGVVSSPDETDKPSCNQTEG